MVCVTQQKNCDRLIKTGTEILGEDEGELYVIHVSKTGVNFLGKEKDGEALEYLYQKAKEHGATLTVVRSNDVVKTLNEIAEKYLISHVVMGSSLEQNHQNDISKQFMDAINQKIIVKIVC